MRAEICRVCRYIYATCAYADRYADICRYADGYERCNHSKQYSTYHCIIYTVYSPMCDCTCIYSNLLIAFGHCKNNKKVAKAEGALILSEYKKECVWGGGGTCPLAPPPCIPVCYDELLSVIPQCSALMLTSHEENFRRH